MFRPPVRYIEGYEEEYQEEPVNDFYYADIGEKRLIIFIGTEPNQHEDIYVNTLLDGARELGVKRIVIPSGVGGEVPFDKERRINCSYSRKRMGKELRDYGVAFSNYDRNATIGMVINHYCKKRGMESIGMTALTPSYEVAISIASDKRAMYDILRRVRHMFGIDLDLTDLEKESKRQTSDFESGLKKLFMDNPEIEPKIAAYMDQIRDGFEELRFIEPTKIPDVFLKEFDNTL
jgi:proteasome assembly chaperone (PAC2) family protein